MATLSSGSGASSKTYYIPASLRKVTLTDTTTLATNAFRNCGNLTEVVLPQNLQTIGENAFFLCAGLTQITIPASVTSIANNAFAQCQNFESITIERPSSSGITTLGNNVFYIDIAASKLANIYVPDSASVTAYKSATNWSTYASLIKQKP